MVIGVPCSSTSSIGLLKGKLFVVSFAAIGFEVGGTTFPLFQRLLRLWPSGQPSSLLSQFSTSHPGQLDLPPGSISPHQALAIVAERRSVGDSISVAAYEQLLLACVEQDQRLAAARLFEEAAQDGVRLDMMSEEAQQILKPVLVPEVEQIQANQENTNRSCDHEGSAELFNDSLPLLWVRPTREGVLEFACAGQLREDAIVAGRAAAASQSSVVVFRGIGLGWPALQEWKLESLSNFFRRGMVRIAPGPAVAVCRELHPDVKSGLVIPTSRALIMNVSEFVDRLHFDRRGRRPVAYGENERCYLHALAPYAMMRQMDFSFFEDDSEGDKMRPETLGRLWISAPGTVSPSHYDLTDSYLCQVRGKKRMLLWPAEVLQQLHPYPLDHVHARRLQVDITGRSLPSDELVLSAVSAAIEVVLEPGDVVFFPAQWAHHTEALPSVDSEGLLEPSISVAFRTDGQYLL